MSSYLWLSIKYITTIVQVYNNIQQCKSGNGFRKQYTNMVFSGTFLTLVNLCP